MDNEFILNFLVNSAWQIAAICVLASIGAYFLKNCSAHYRHVVWITALVLCLVGPAITATEMVPAVATSFGSGDIRNFVTTTDDTDETLVPNHTKRRNSQVPVNTTPRNMQLIAAAYFIFLGLCALRFVRLWQTKERLRRSVSLTGLTPPMETALKRCMALFGIERVQLGRSPTVRVPCTVGIRRPLIVLPDSFCGDVDHETLLSVIAHEMAHVRRKDFLAKLICELVSLPISFHPLTFLIKRQIERERELACDELVTRQVLQPETYARSLMRAADLSILPARRSIMLSVFDGRMLEERIRLLMHRQFSLRKWPARIIATVVVGVLCVCSLLGSAFGFSFGPQKSTKSTSLLAPVVDVPQKPVATSSGQETKVRVATRISSPVQQEPQQLAQSACDAGRNRDDAAIPSLVAMLGDDRQIEPIACYTSGRWTPALDTFKRPSPGEQAALALASMGRTALGPLMNQLANPNATTRRNAAWAIGELTNMVPGDRAPAVPQLINLLSDSDPWVRMAAARALGEVRDRLASSMLTATLADSDWRVRRLAAWALNEMKEERAVPALSDLLLRDSRVEVRVAAAEALGEIRSSAALLALQRALNDADASVRSKASWAISEIQ
jgi:beta-lactamase regulating signal transducer with metallopeptidase domain